VNMVPLTSWLILSLFFCVSAGHAETATEDGMAAADESAADKSEQAMLRFINTPWSGDLDGMLERGLIRALVVPSKTMYFVEQGKPRGIAYELLTTFQDQLNKKYPPSTKHIKTYVAFVPVSQDQLISALLEGRGDLAVSGLTITPERGKLVDFSRPFFRDINEIVVTGPASPELETIEDLSGQEIYVRPSSSYWEHLQRFNERFEAEGKAPVTLDPAPEVLKDEDLMEMLNAGLGGVLVVDDYKAELWSQVFTNIRLHPEMQINGGGEIGWMMRPDSPGLKAEVDAFARSHGQGSLLGNILVRRYVDNSRFVKNATSPAELDKFNRVVGLFRLYAGEYELDYLLMLAQGYQESGLNHQARSPVGARGIMQLMPATGEQMGVGDTAELDANIHAGVKYIRHLIDTYFEDQPMDELNKTLFAFAAYNAGPGRVRSLRRTAAKSGLDPNLWFNNVELIAAKKIGSETVTYVSNIFKYYVAFKLVQEEEAERRAAKAAINKGGK